MWTKQFPSLKFYSWSMVLHQKSDKSLSASSGRQEHLFRFRRWHRTDALKDAQLQHQILLYGFVKYSSQITYSSVNSLNLSAVTKAQSRHNFKTIQHWIHIDLLSQFWFFERSHTQTYHTWNQEGTLAFKILYKSIHSYICKPTRWYFTLWGSWLWVQLCSIQTLSTTWKNSLITNVQILLLFLCEVRAWRAPTNVVNYHICTVLTTHALQIKNKNKNLIRLLGRKGSERHQ